jgi:chromosome segregation ATPase
VAAQDRLTQANATIRALETHSGRSAEVEQVLTESESRLAETEEKLIEAESRLEQLAHQLEDRDYRIGQLEQRATVQKRTVDTLSGQLAESETLSEEHSGRIRELERENERLRRDLSEAQTRMLDSRGDIDEAREAERAAKAELERAREDLRAERSRVDKTRVETGRVRDELTAAHKRADSAEAELKTTTQQLEEARKTADKRKLEAEQTLAAARGAERRAKDLEDKFARATRELAEAEGKLQTGIAAAQQAAQQAALEAGNAREEAQRARAELDGVRRSEGSTSDAAMRLRAELAQARTELAASREEAAAARDLLNDKVQRAEEKLALGAERTRNGEAERKALAEALGSAEQRLRDQAAQDEAAINRARAEVAEQARLAAQARTELEGLKGKLNESDAYVITRERELEKHANRVKYLLSEIGSVADLRTKFEAESDPARRDEFASLLARKLDSLFVEAGKRVNADRRTEKIVILHVKKDAQQIDDEAEKPFVATKEKEVSKAAKPSPRKKRDAQS